MKEALTIHDAAYFLDCVLTDSDSRAFLIGRLGSENVPPSAYKARPHQLDAIGKLFVMAGEAFEAEVQAEIKSTIDAHMTTQEK